MSKDAWLNQKMAGCFQSDGIRVSCWSLTGLNSDWEQYAHPRLLAKLTVRTILHEIQTGESEHALA